MKKEIFVLFAILLLFQWVNGQNNGQRKKPQASATTNQRTNGNRQGTVQKPAVNIPKGYLDTTGVNDFKNNTKPAATNVKGNTTNPQAGNQNQRTVQTNSTPVKQTKLDDLKNPFDSTKKVKQGVQSGQAPASQKGRANRQ